MPAIIGTNKDAFIFIKAFTETKSVFLTGHNSFRKWNLLLPLSFLNEKAANKVTTRRGAPYNSLTQVELRRRGNTTSPKEVLLKKVPPKKV
jgi:hypothetical protein